MMTRGCSHYLERRPEAPEPSSDLGQSRPPARSWEQAASGLCLWKSGLKTTNSLSIRVQTPKQTGGQSATNGCGHAFEVS